MPSILPGFRGTHFTDARIERFSCPTDFARRYGRRLHRSRNLLVLLHANAVQLQTGPDGNAVDRITVETLQMRRFTIRPRLVVLAAGGLETIRLMLASRSTRHPAGLGNAHDQLGRCYMTHLAGTAGEITLPEGAMPNAGYKISDDGIYCRRRFALTEAAQARFGVGNFIARLHHPPIPDPRHRTGALSAVYLARPFITPEYASRLGGQPPSLRNLLRHASNLLTDGPGAARLATHLTRRRHLATRKFPSLVVTPRNGRYSLDFHAEQAPNPESRITLLPERDRLGLPKLKVDWRASAIDLRTVRMSIAALAEDFAASGAARLTCDEDALTEQIERAGAYGGHHIGAARMAHSPRQGVVDEHCRVHGMANVYVAGSAVFPTSGQANPTLTIVALALRLAAHLQSAH